MPFPVAGVFGCPVVIKPETRTRLCLNFKIEPANAPGASLDSNGSMLGLHIAPHAAPATEVLPLRKASFYPKLFPVPGEGIGAWGTLAMQWDFIKVDGNFFGYEMFNL